MGTVETKEVNELADRILDTIRAWGEERGGIDDNVMAAGIALAITLIGRDVDKTIPETVANILIMKHPQVESHQ